MNLCTADFERRDPLLVLKDSLSDMPGIEDEVRYKIVIHSSEDDSLVRLLFQYEVLERQNTRIYICSDFPGDTELQKVFMCMTVILLLLYNSMLHMLCFRNYTMAIEGL